MGVMYGFCLAVYARDTSLWCLWLVLVVEGCRVVGRDCNWGSRGVALVFLLKSVAVHWFEEVYLEDSRLDLIKMGSSADMLL